MFEVPILFVVFNRPDTTKLVFEKIKKIKPSKLFISSDYYREWKLGEKEKCDEVRRIILDNIDWNCQVFTKFNDKNLGCKYAVSSAINWFFENVDSGIILEDDCLPSDSFFEFCKVNLEYYKDDKRIMHIGGTNFQKTNKRGEYTYYFSKFVHVWGWATWKRAWKYYDVEMKNFEEFKKNNCIRNIFDCKKQQKRFLNIFEETYNKRIDTWDYQWFYTVISQNGLSIIPNKNLVSNIGFNEHATHTKDKMSTFSNMNSYELNEEIKHPQFLLQNKIADEFTYNIMFKNKNIIQRIIRKILLYVDSVITN
jgi:hypothetical protein